MNARHSTSFRSSQSSRSSSARSKSSSRLQRTRYCGGATAPIGSICKNPRRRTVSRTPVADPSRSCERTAIRRACARLTSLDFATFALSHLPPAPARVLEVGCGRRGGITSALADAGYDVLGIDPDVSVGERFRTVTLEELDEEPFDAIVAERVFHHVHPLGAALDKVARMAPLFVLDEFAWERMDEPTRDWYEAQHRMLVAAGRDPLGPPNLAEWRAEHEDLHPS